MMKGYLQAGGLRVSDKRIGRILRQVAPGYHGRRQQLAHRQINPVPYYAQYPGHKTRFSVCTCVRLFYM